MSDCERRRIMADVPFGYSTRAVHEGLTNRYSSRIDEEARAREDARFAEQDMVMRGPDGDPGNWAPEDQEDARTDAILMARLADVSELRTARARAGGGAGGGGAAAPHMQPTLRYTPDNSAMPVRVRTVFADIYSDLNHWDQLRGSSAAAKIKYAVCRKDRHISLLSVLVPLIALAILAHALM